MPGFVDPHRRLLRSLTPAVTNSGSPWHGNLTPDGVYAASLVGLLQALQAGITTVVDWCDVTGDIDHLEASASAHAESGMRTVLVRSNPGWTPSGDTPIASASPALGEAELDAVSAHWASARAQGLRIHARAGSAPSTQGEVAELGRRGLLGPDVTLSGCANLNDADFDAIAASSAAVVLTPTSDLIAGVAPHPARQLLDRGVRPGLGTGDARDAPPDMFGRMRTVMSIERSRTFGRKLAGDSEVVHVLNTRDVIRLATVGGATAAGLASITGSLTPGKCADVIVLRTDRPNVTPVNDPIGAVVWGMDTSNVDWVFVGGTSLVEHGELAADVARARALAADAQQPAIGSTGRLADAGATPR
jgi:cytosine/adenosine deaminase-related metal-dependent hydrolase